MLCYSKTRKIKYFCPPPKNKAQGCEWSRYVYTHKCLSIPTARIFTKSRLSRLSDSNYKVIPSLKIII